MLQKFLFIGLGGSGGKTLRMLYDFLQQRLIEAHYDGEMPGAWQFVQIDVPVVADGNSPDLPKQLPPRSYVGMARQGLTYSDLDDLLIQKGQSVVEHSAGWRPRPDRVGINPMAGAGQYRAVGRAITAASIQNVSSGLQQAINTLNDVAINSELSKVSLALTNNGTPSKHAPQPVIVSSIAGGSGAGALLDVCDVIRGLAPNWGKNSVSLMFLPDVFDDIPSASRTGITANALATISELMAGYWSAGENTDEHALLESAGIPVAGGGRRGPRFPLLVGRSNGQVYFSSQTEVYRAAARALAAWTVDPAVQDNVNVSFLGNWSNTAESRGDATGLTVGEGREVPFSALGFASVGLGRGRFARYTAERLARAAVEQLLRGHWTPDVPHKRAHEDARDERATSVKHHFLEQCGLRELGPHHNQIIDAVRGGEQAVARAPREQGLQQRIQGGLRVNGDTDASHVLRQILTDLENNRTRFLDVERQDDLERARAWQQETQRVVTAETARLLGQEGAAVTGAVLELAIKELSQAVVPELKEMTSAAASWAASHEQRVRSTFAGFDGKILADNPLISKAITEGVNSFHAESEATLYTLCAELAADLAANCLAPLREAVRGAEQGLTAAEQGSPERPSIIKTWPQTSVPQAYLPAQNEIVLDDIDTYPQRFAELVRTTAGARDEHGGLLTAIRDVVSGEGFDASDSTVAAVTRTGDWIPPTGLLGTHATPRAAQFRIDVSPEALLQRANDWIHRPDTAIGRYIDESLRDYLEESQTADAQLVAQRLERFRTGLTDAVTASRPLVRINDALEAKVHGGSEVTGSRYLEIPTPFPFPSGHPARDIVRDVFRHVQEEQLDRMFDDSEQSRIEITTFLSAPSHAMVFDSLADPIRSDWAKARTQPNLNGFWDRRRARPLSQFVPAPHDYVKAMVRGWFTARLLGHIQVSDVNHEPVRLWSESGDLTFPHPLLGSPIEDMRDLLPAVLESMALAHVLDPPASMAPYRQLALLGNPRQAWTSRDEAVRNWLSRWVMAGETPAGAPLPDAGLAGTVEGSADDRSKYITAFLETAERTYNSINERTIDAQTALELPRVWEIRELVLAALSELRAHVQDLKIVEPRGEGVW